MPFVKSDWLTGCCIVRTIPMSNTWTTNWRTSKNSWQHYNRGSELNMQWNSKNWLVLSSGQTEKQYFSSKISTVKSVHWKFSRDILSEFLSPIVTVASAWNSGETGDIYSRQQNDLHSKKFVHTNLISAGFELGSLGPQASVLPIEPVKLLLITFNYNQFKRSYCVRKCPQTVSWQVSNLSHTGRIWIPD